MPKGLGVSAEGNLKKVPSSPNCISGQAKETDEKHFMPAWTFEDLGIAKFKIEKNIADSGNSEIKPTSQITFMPFSLRVFDGIRTMLNFFLIKRRD